MKALANYIPIGKWRRSNVLWHTQKVSPNAPPYVLLVLLTDEGHLAWPRCPSSPGGKHCKTTAITSFAGPTRAMPFRGLDPWAFCTWHTPSEHMHCADTHEVCTNSLSLRPPDSGISPGQEGRPGAVTSSCPALPCCATSPGCCGSVPYPRRGAAWPAPRGRALGRALRLGRCWATEQGAVLVPAAVAKGREGLLTL